MGGVVDPSLAERRALLAIRSRRVAAQWSRIRRAIAERKSWRAAERRLVETIPTDSLDAPLVALAEELEALLLLEDHLFALRRGDERALEPLLDRLTEGEHLETLMPGGRLPRSPAPTIAAILGGIKGDLLGRVVVQWIVEGANPPRGVGELELKLRYAPSWGQTGRSLLLGLQRTLLISHRALPDEWTFRWDRRGFRLIGRGGARPGNQQPSLVLVGRWDRPGQWGIAAEARFDLEPIPLAGPWPLLPPVIDEDGRRQEGKGGRSPRAGARGFSAVLLHEAPGQARRIERALAVLDAAWPSGAATVRDFTRAIIPVTQPEVVSYSFAPVPGWSYVNLYDRDFVDLIDDLVHENAHHHLNHRLAATALLSARRDAGLRYYSPWREALRPVRGLLHSAFTFSVGAALFHRLWRALEGEVALPHRFSPSERRKIAARCLEEALQVRYTLVDLSDAHRRGLLTARGAALCGALTREIDRCLAIAPALRRTIAGTVWARRIADLERTLAAQRRETGGKRSASLRSRR